MLFRPILPSSVEGVACAEGTDGGFTARVENAVSVVDRVNPPEAGMHMRLLVRLTGALVT